MTDSARSLLRDWRVGKFPYHTSPPASSSTASTTPQYAAADEIVLPTLRTRKELRTTGGGLVRLSAGSIDTRDIRLDAPPQPSEPAPRTKKVVVVEEAMDEDDEDDDEEVEDELDEDEDEGEEDEEEEEESPPPPPPSKRKRNAADPSAAAKRKKVQPPPTLARKVSFAAETKGKSAPALAGKPKSALKATKAAGPKAPKTTATPKAQVAKPAKSSLPSEKPKATTSGAASGNGEAYDFKAFF